MKRILPWVLRILIGLALAFLGAGAVMLLRGEHHKIMPLWSGAMLCLAIASGGYSPSRKWAFFIWLISAVVIGMTFPSWFIRVGDFKFTRLFMPLLQLIMFCMGTTLSVNDFARVVRMPAGVLVGVACQFAIMPLLGYGLAKVSGFPPEVGAGIVLVGSVPSGLASTVMVYLAKADVALSVTLTAITSLLAPVITPFMMQWLAGEMVQIDAGKLMWDLTKMTVIPVLAGLAWNHFMQNRAKWLTRVMPYFSILGILAMTLLTIAIGRDNLLRLGVTLIGVCLLHSTTGYLLGYLVCRSLRMREATCRTIAFEVGMQNAGMASAVAASLNKVATLGLAPIVFGPVMNITASCLANWWRARSTEQQPDRD
jgi:BASS family bile acid:Na+ symporter